MIYVSGYEMTCVYNYLPSQNAFRQLMGASTKPRARCLVPGTHFLYVLMRGESYAISVHNTRANLMDHRFAGYENFYFRNMGAYIKVNDLVYFQSTGGTVHSIDIGTNEIKENAELDREY